MIYTLGLTGMMIKHCVSEVTKSDQDLINNSVVFFDNICTVLG